MASLKDRGQLILYHFFDPVLHLLRKLGITPNHLTLAGLLLNIAAAYWLVCCPSGDLSFFYFGLWVLTGGLMDVLDGRMARKYNVSSRYGAFFDSVIDRYSEFVMYLGVILHCYFLNDLLGLVLAFGCTAGSIMVSYNRARAEGLGVSISVGFWQRPERIVFIGVFCLIVGLFGKSMIVPGTDLELNLLHIFLGLLFVGTQLTAFRRMFAAKELLNMS